MRQRKSTWTSIGDYPAFVLQTDAMVDFHHMGTDQRNVDREGCGIYPAAHAFAGVDPYSGEHGLSERTLLRADFGTAKRSTKKHRLYGAPESEV